MFYVSREIHTSQCYCTILLLSVAIFHSAAGGHRHAL